jgi:hypothetical protein
MLITALASNEFGEFASGTADAGRRTLIRLRHAAAANAIKMGATTQRSPWSRSFRCGEVPYAERNRFPPAAV